MTLGEPDTPEERAAEQRRLEARAAARARRDAQIAQDVAEDLACGNSLEKACLSAARRYKLGRGGAGYVKGLVS